MITQFKLQRLFVIAMAFLLNAGCAINVNTEYNSQANFGAYKTYKWRAPTTEKVQDPILDSPFLEKRVAKAVSEVMAGQGLVANDATADIVITYHVTSKQRFHNPNFSAGIAYNPHRWGGGFLFDDEVESYDEAVLILDVIDAKTNDLIWRGWQTHALSQNNFDEPAVKKMVEAIFAKFPPGKS
jgi:hypothetical protein